MRGNNHEESKLARQLRIEFPGAFYHVTSRGNEKKAVFHSTRDREKYLSYLESAYDRYGAIIHVYCLMENHYHLLLETPRGNLSQVLHHINGAYTTYFNIKRNRSGHLFQGRFKGILVDKEAYCKELSRYIHLNPVRAGIVKTPLEYPWSSYRYYIGKTKKPQWLATEFVLEDFGGEGRVGFRRYREYVERVETKELRDPFKSVIVSTFLGGEDFINRIRMEYLEKKKIDKRNIPAIKIVLKGPSLEEIEKGASKRLGRNHPFFKKVCIYLSHQYSGLGLNEIGTYWGMKGSAISQLSRRFKEVIKGDRELGETVNEIKRENLLNVET
jgi:REP element-mobilizing transposase RayT